MNLAGNFQRRLRARTIVLRTEHPFKIGSHHYVISGTASDTPGVDYRVVIVNKRGAFVWPN